MGGRILGAIEVEIGKMKSNKFPTGRSTGSLALPHRVEADYIVVFYLSSSSVCPSISSSSHDLPSPLIDPLFICP